MLSNKGKKTSVYFSVDVVFLLQMSMYFCSIIVDLIRKCIKDKRIGY